MKITTTGLEFLVLIAEGLVVALSAILVIIYRKFSIWYPIAAIYLYSILKIIDAMKIGNAGVGPIDQIVYVLFFMWLLLASLKECESSAKEQENSVPETA